MQSEAPMTDKEQLAAVKSLVSDLRMHIEYITHERNILQKICARRAACLEAAGLHADCTIEEAQEALRISLAR